MIEEHHNLKGDRKGSVTYAAIDLSSLPPSSLSRNRPNIPKSKSKSKVQLGAVSDCDECGGLVDKHNQWMRKPALAAIVTICTRLPKASKILTLLDYSVMLISHSGKYSLPEAVSPPGEPMKDTAERLAHAFVATKTPKCIELLGDPARYTQETHTISTVYFVAAETEDFIPTDKFRLFTVQEAVELANTGWLLSDHCEAIYALAGFLKTQASQIPQSDALFLRRQQYVLQQQMNPVFDRPNLHLLDTCVRSWSNPHFKSGVLKPKESDSRNGSLSRINQARSKPLELDDEDTHDNPWKVDDHDNDNNDSDDDNSTSSHSNMNGRADSVGYYSRGEADLRKNSRISTHNNDGSDDEDAISDIDESLFEMAVKPVMLRQSTTDGGLPRDPKSPQAPISSALRFHSNNSSIDRGRRSNRDSMEVLMNADFNPMHTDLHEDFSNPLFQNSP